MSRARLRVYLQLHSQLRILLQASVLPIACDRTRPAAMPSTWLLAADLACSDLLQVSDDGEVRVVAEGDDLLVDHEAEDAKHGRAAVVELDGALGELGLLVEGVPAEVNVAVVEVAHELVAGSRDIAHEGALQHANEGDQLHEAGSGDGVWANEGGNAVGEGVEGVAGVVNVAGEVEPGTGGDLAQEGKLGDAAVLDLDVTETVEALLGAVTVEHAEGVVEPERGLGAELVLEGADGRGGLGRGGGGEGGGRADEGGEDGRLHDGNGVWILFVPGDYGNAVCS